MTAPPAFLRTLRTPCAGHLIHSLWTVLGDNVVEPLDASRSDRRTVTFDRPHRVWLPGGKPVDDAVDNGAKGHTVAVVWTENGVIRSVMHLLSTMPNHSWAGQTRVIPSMHSTEDDEGFSL
jgi:hypothetical protein